ncbi:RNA-directed DNA polymerase, eukaryota [Tanacetum coccineum]
MDQNNLNDFDPTDTYDHYDAIFQPDYDRYMRDYESYQHYVGLCEQEAGGSSDGPKRRRTYIYREREEAEQRLIDDYFGDDEYEPKYPEEKFRRRYRMSSRLFNKILNDILSYDVQPLPEYFSYFRSRLDATGRNSIGSILKCTSAIRQMAYDTSPDAFDEYLQIAERTSRECLDHFTKCIHVLYYDKFLRRPTATDIQKTYELHEEKHGLPGMLGSIDCMHWDWKNCPKSLHGQFKRSTNKYPTLMLEAVADQKLWIWHAYFRHGLRLSKRLIVARDEKTLKFKRVQEAARKDIERAFRVLQDEGFEVNLRDVFVNPAPNIVRDWVERCDLHVRKTKELRDRKTHTDLRQDLMEHLWNNDDE